jgi:hypothetical protein
MRAVERDSGGTSAAPGDGLASAVATTPKVDVRFWGCR